MKNRSDDPSHYERTLLPQSYIPSGRRHQRLNGTVRAETDCILHTAVNKGMYADRHTGGQKHDTSCTSYNTLQLVTTC